MHPNDPADRIRPQIPESQIQRFYEDANVFITGATGFMGKILIEKLLRSTEVATLYLLVREKKGKDVHTRIDEIFDDIVFQRVKSESPKFKHKIVPISGDCCAAGLGLTITDRQTLIKNVNVVFHVAATVNFDEKLRTAYSINVKGSECVLDLCKQIENLKSFVHVSTAYSNCHLTKVNETFYDYSINYRDVEAAIEKLDDATIEKCTPKILGNWPNTYTFSKALAEAMIRDQGSGLPIGIFRPAVVVSTYKEPIAGWIDNFYGPTGVCAGAASGLLRTISCDDDILANIVPVDTCVAGLLASAWDVATKQCERIPENIPIYNYVSTVENPITWGEYHLINKLYGEVYPLLNTVWCIKFNSTRSATTNALRKFTRHCVPAVVLDVLGLFLGKKPSMMKMYQKVHKFSDVISYFCTRNWHFSNDNVIKLWNKMNREDRELFPLSMGEVHWLLYFRNYILGIRLYLLKDSIETMPQAKVKQRRFKMLHNLLQYTICFVTANLIWNVANRGISWLTSYNNII